MRWKNALAIGGALLVSAVGVTAQTNSGIDPPPEEPMARMMLLMKDMQAEMQVMRKQMGMQGMGGMQGNMDKMMGRMGEMRSMMEQHRLQMKQECPGFKAPAAPKSGG